ncbi:MAG TPA: dihydropteroate synthase, partial [Micromonospora sp.]|nr:dihydropteroate synthase [Micromonospora sp.]
MAGSLRLGPRTFGPEELVVMAIINRTPDSFFDRGATYQADAALRAAEQAVTEGAEILDIGGVKAGPGTEVSAAEEIRRTVATIAAVRETFPDVVISIDTWRAEVAIEAVAAGADLLNDTWSGPDPALARVAAETGTGLLCSHAGGLAPRTRPHRAAFDDVVTDVVETVTGLAERAAQLGVRRDGILIDPTHDFGKNTRHSLEITR